MPDQAARWWRADGGYQEAPPRPHPPEPEPTAPGMLYYGQWGWPPACQPYTPWQAPPMAYYGQPYPGYPAHMQGPIPIAGLYQPRPPPQPEHKEKDEGDKKKQKKDEGKAEEKKEKKRNPRAPPPMQEHSNYIFGLSHTMIHVFNKATPVWDKKYRTEKLRFKKFTVSTKFTVKDIIEFVVAREDGDYKEWAVSQAYERGDGGWVKGSTINYDSSRSAGTLASMGWSGRRGEALEPVWLVVHMVGFKNPKD